MLRDNLIEQVLFAADVGFRGKLGQVRRPSDARGARARKNSFHRRLGNNVAVIANFVANAISVFLDLVSIDHVSILQMDFLGPRPGGEKACQYKP